MRKTAWLALALASFTAPAWAADDLMSSQLVDEARQWQEKDRDDLAAAVWRKLLRAVPNHPAALVNLGLIEARAGNLKEARVFWSRASQLSTPPAGLDRLSAAVSTTKSAPETAPPSPLEQSRALDALTIVVRDKPVKPVEIKPSSEALLETYQSPEAIKQKWAASRRGLEKLVRENPGDSRYPIALARHLSYREGTQREAIRQISGLTQRGLGNQETEQLWQKTLLSLKTKPGDRALLSSYLTRFPDDKAVKERLRTLEQQEAALAQSKQNEARRVAKIDNKAPASAAAVNADTNQKTAPESPPQAQSIVPATRQDDAVVQLESTTQLDVRNPWVRQAMARQDQNPAAAEGAEAAFDSLDEADAAKPEALFARATLYSTQQKWWDALNTLEKIPASARTASMALEQRHVWVNAQVQRALQFFNQGRVQQAYVLMDQAQAAAGLDAELLMTVAGGWFDLGQSAKGLRLMRETVSGNSVKTVATQIKYAKLLLNARQDATLATVLSELASTGRLNTAQEAEVNRIILGYTLRLTEFLRESGRYAEAAATVNPALQRLDDNRLLLSKARIYKAEGDFTAALALLEKVIDREPSDISHRLLASEAAFSANKMDKAAQHIKAALAQAPNHPRVLAMAGRVEKARGNTPQSFDYFQRSLIRESDKSTFAGAPDNLSLRLLGQVPDSLNLPLSSNKPDLINRPGLLPIPVFKTQSDRTPAGVGSAPPPDVDRAATRLE